MEEVHERSLQNQVVVVASWVVELDVDYRCSYSEGYSDLHSDNPGSSFEIHCTVDG